MWYLKENILPQGSQNSWMRDLHRFPKQVAKPIAVLISHPWTCDLAWNEPTRTRMSWKKRKPGLHRHLGLQLSKLFFFVLLFCMRRGFPFDYCRRIISEAALCIFVGCNSLSPFAAEGNLWISSDTGTVPVFNILLSNCSCSSSANSSSSSPSSTGSPIGAPVIASAIS